MNKPVDYDELFPNRFLKAGLLRGRPVTYTIKDVITEPLPQDNGKDRTRGILIFAETTFQLVLNSTNGQCVRAMFGRRVPDWIGKRITFVPAIDKFGKKTVDCVRIGGSPDLAGDVSVEIALPRKKPKTVRLARTSAADGEFSVIARAIELAESAEDLDAAALMLKSARENKTVKPDEYKELVEAAKTKRAELEQDVATTQHGTTAPEEIAS